MRQQAQLSIFFGGIDLLSMKNCAQSDDLGNWALVAPYLCVRFFIFDKPILEEFFFRLKVAHTAWSHAFM
jgi:hypothetical protein